MESFVTTPPLGACANWPTQKEAKKLFEYFEKGSRTDVILLGDVIEQKVHWVTTKGRKILCTAVTGSCQACLLCGESIDVSDQQTEFYAPAMKLKKDRRFHQCVAVFTEGMYTELRSEVLTDGPDRGHRFELRRHSSQKFTIVSSRSQPSVLAVAMPISFDVLPWVRAKFARPQDPMRPAVRLEPFALRDIDSRPLTQPKPLDLSVTDCDDVPSPEEVAKIKDMLKAKLAEMRAEPSAVESVPIVVEPPAAAPVELEVKPLGELAVTERAADPENYGPKTRIGGTGIDPALKTPDTTTPGQDLVGSLIDHIPALRGGLNGHAKTNGKKGGGA